MSATPVSTPRAPIDWDAIAVNLRTLYDQGVSGLREERDSLIRSVLELQHERTMLKMTLEGQASRDIQTISILSDERDCLRFTVHKLEDLLKEHRSLQASWDQKQSDLMNERDSLLVTVQSLELERDFLVETLHVRER
ncbi:hypothetical protein BDZ89DRAFT_1131413 [Hymenopellis radicata]|nr:hypothetical protein BDZ89DRAFT_1131413 [Hymenopellis radicata]